MANYTIYDKLVHLHVGLHFNLFLKPFINYVFRGMSFHPVDSALIFLFSFLKEGGQNERKCNFVKYTIINFLPKINLIFGYN